jgi:ribonuclease Y
MDYANLVYIIVAAAVVSYGAIIFVSKILLPRKLKGENNDRKHAVLMDAQRRAELIKQETLRRTEQNLQDMLEELSEQISARTEDLKVAETELESQEEFATHAEQRITKQQNEVELAERKAQSARDKFQNSQNEVAEARITLIENLEKGGGAVAEDLKKSIAQNRIEKRTLECQKVLKNLEQDVSENARKLASRMLFRTESRYFPNFVWPKAINTVDIPDKSLIDTLQLPETTLLSDLSSLSEGVTVEVVVNPNENIPPFVKFAGGFGVYREAARLTLEELLKMGNSQWHRSKSIYQKHLTALQQQALKLGQQAVRELRLDGVHEEIQKMVGYLNWRTSYRQNQYLHTLEVAKLAGLLAHEVGVDPDAAKRSGLMHDIGKTLDYRIEGSHAVISGDYADRFGESRLICDTCMSHHNDLVLETPLSYVLKAADTLSGARPGARVNLEEGYQIRISAIDEVVRSFKGIAKVSIMNGGREVHVEVHHKKVEEGELDDLTKSIARKIETDVAFPGQIKVLVSRRFESNAVA